MSELFSTVLDVLSQKKSTSGSLLRAFRKALKLTQEELSDITGIQNVNIG